MNEIEQRLEEIRAREAATTEGPWFPGYYGPEVSTPPYWAVTCHGGELLVAIVHYGYGNPGEEEANAQFLGHSKADISFLLDHIADLAAELRATKTALEDARTDRARVALETRKAARLESTAEVERLRAIIDAIVTGPGVEAEVPNGD